jgi:Flp pilus assembly protein TadG
MEVLRLKHRLEKRWMLFGSDAGTAAVEFAIAVPVFLYLWFGIVDVGRSMAFGAVAQGVSRTATEYGAANLMQAKDVTGMKTWATDDAENLPSYTITVNQLCSVNGAQPPTACTFTSSPPPAGTLYYIQVVVNDSFNTLAKYPGIPSTITVSGQTYMQVQNQ